MELVLIAGQILISNANANTTPICSCYEGKTPANSLNTAYAKGNGTTCFRYPEFDRLFIRDDNYTDATLFTSVVTGQKLVYELATPITIQLTPNQIALLQGSNYLSTNCQNLKLTYRTGQMATLGDVKDAVDELRREIPVQSGHIYSTTEHIVGQWIDGKPIYEKTISDTSTRTTGSNTISTGISNLETLIELKGTVSYGSNVTWLPIPLSDDPSSSMSNSQVKFGGLNKNNGNVAFYIGTDYTGVVNVVNKVIVTLRYTKTTDYPS